MDDNRICFLCQHSLAYQFCSTCTNLPLLCARCQDKHDSLPGFHFTLPIAALNCINTENQHSYINWLQKVRNSQGKLQENIKALEKYKTKIETGYMVLHSKMEQSKARLMHIIDSLKITLSAKISEAIKETSANAYLQDYQPSTPLARLIWTDCWESSSAPIEAIRCTITVAEDCLKDCLEATFTSPDSELTEWNKETEGGFLKKVLAEERDRNQQLCMELHLRKSRPLPTQNCSRAVLLPAFPGAALHGPDTSITTEPRTRRNSYRVEFPLPVEPRGAQYQPQPIRVHQRFQSRPRSRSGAAVSEIYSQRNGQI